LVLAALPSPAHAADLSPARWPSSPGVDPMIDTTAHGIRFAGPDRYQTNLSTSLALRGMGNYPFDTPDPTSGGASGLAAANDWWGAASCPRSILVVAGDTFADALTASSLSDPLDRSSQPFLQRVAAADPLFDPVGGFDRVDTAFAPIVLTGATRGGFTALSQTAKVAATDLAKGGCRTAREAIIVGGSSSVPQGVEAELVGLGYAEVFRVAGSDRYETAARVAQALTTGQGTTAAACSDPRADDGSVRSGFYGNGVVEFRPTPTECQLLSRSVVLADGGTGADALAAGWWTSRWQVPVLLTAPDGSLPPATRTALLTLDVDTIIVLGGAGRIPESTVSEASAIAGNAVYGRIAGADRYETSVRMAQVFGGWYALGDGTGFDADVACFAASGGSGAASAGWGDALAAGPLCARIAAAGGGAPARALPPASGGAGSMAGDGTPSHDSSPVLLLPPGGAVPTSVATYLQQAFSRGRAWCTGAASQSCVEPGFAVAFGGSGGVSDAAFRDVSTFVSGGAYTDVADLDPDASGAFFTELDLAPLFNSIGSGDVRGCLPADATRDARWLSALRSSGQPLVSIDLVNVGAYPADGTPGNAPFCAIAPRSSVAAVSVTSVSGHSRTLLGAPPAATDMLRLSSPLTQSGSRSGATGAYLFDGPIEASAALVKKGQSIPITAARVDVAVDVTGMFAGSAQLDLGDQVVVVELSGTSSEADGVQVLRGPAQVVFGGVRHRGGFRLDLSSTGGSWVATWTFDGAPAT
jgi:hypothetical protein